MPTSKLTLTTEIRKLRFESQEMTQQELAALVGVTRQTIVALEAGKYIPSLALAYKISQIFDSAIEDVFHLTG